MPIKLAALTRATRTVPVDSEGLAVSLTYAPGKLTPAVEARLNDANEHNRPASGVADELANIITGWDILGDDGKPVAISADQLHEFPTRFLLACVQAIGSDARPNAVSAES